MQNNPNPILGTAMWGWTTPKETCFKLLSHFYETGFRQVDTATNYPINKNGEDFRLAEKILQEWIVVNGVSDLQIITKSGSLNNLGGPENNLTKSFLLLVLDEYEFLFHDNLNTFSIHWDNRQEEDSILDTFEALNIAAQQGLKVGLSGVKYPEVYARINKAYELDFRIQIKHNLLYSDFDRYAPLHEHGSFLAYGINAGGLKLDVKQYNTDSSLKARGGNPELGNRLSPALLEIFKKANQKSERPPVQNLNECGLCFAWYQEKMDGIILGPSRVDQLEQSIRFLKHLTDFDYRDLYEDLVQLNRSIKD